jgi:protein-glucosylgalactosylhydroxylysine glucosidase
MNWNQHFIRIIIPTFIALTATNHVNAQQCEGCIDREALVKRHTISVEKFDTLASLSVGNGEFAFTVDATGLQTFPEYYEKGIPLCTQSQWGWHSFPNTGDYKLEETFKEYNVHGRKIKYSAQIKEPARRKEASDYLRINPHRLHLGVIGLELLNADGSKIKREDISAIHQELDMWKGEIHSSFRVMNTPVDVITFCHQDKDLVAVEIRSSLIRQGLLKINLRFPYPTGGHVDSGCDWGKNDKHQTILSGINPSSVSIQHNIDNTTYYAKIDWSGQGSVTETALHYFVLSPATDQDKFAFTCLFSEKSNVAKIPTFNETKANNEIAWKNFWTKGGAVDFSGSTDPRAPELERRIVLSQYLTKVNCAGSVPPQETGLTCNSWYGKFHTEMHWWHAAHFALWNRTELLEKSLSWYKNIMPKAKEIAQRQGFDGVRWPKMTDPAGNEAPSSIGGVLIWEEPHIIYFAELCYRQQPEKATLYKYLDQVVQTADFMASYAWFDKEKNRYLLGPALIPAQECFDAATTINPPFELEYWYWGLSTAQRWLERMGRVRNPKWDDVLSKLSVLAQSKGLYLGAESVPDTYTTPKYTTDHPAVLGAYGLLPGSRLVDSTTMRRTFDYIWANWKWEDTWGWDFPLTAMSATRLGLPDKAIDALFMKSEKNTYLVNGHNYQDARLRLYLPGNGGLLSAIAMMCAGYDGCKTETPGFPKNGQWKVRWENLQKMP